MTRTLPPTPPGHPLFGNVPEMRKGYIAFLLRCAETYGALFRLRAGPLYLNFVADPDTIREVLIDTKRYHRSARARQVTLKFLGEGLPLSNGAYHDQQRRLMTPAFHKSRVEAYSRSMVAHTQRLIDSWQPDQRIDVLDEMTRLTLTIVVMSLFNTDLWEDSGELGQAMKLFSDAISRRADQRLIPPDLLNPQSRIEQKAINTVDAMIYKLIAARRESEEDTGDLLSMLLMARTEEGEALTDLQIRNESLSLFFAGHETTANTFTWTFYLLSQHPHIEARLFSEIKDVLGDRSPTLDDLPKLPYVDQVVKEVMRLYPAAWMLDRTPTEDVELCGYRIKKGAMMLISPYMMHHNPRYFEDPERFDPERFAKGREELIPRNTYLPFGMGPRVCIGQQFAMMELRLVLATIIQRVHLGMPPGQEIPPRYSGLLTPKERVVMTVEPR